MLHQLHRAGATWQRSARRTLSVVLVRSMPLSILSRLDLPAPGGPSSSVSLPCTSQSASQVSESTPRHHSSWLRGCAQAVQLAQHCAATSPHLDVLQGCHMRRGQPFKGLVPCGLLFTATCASGAGSVNARTRAHRLEHAADAVQDAEGLLGALLRQQGSHQVLRSVSEAVEQRGQRAAAGVDRCLQREVAEAHLHSTLDLSCSPWCLLSLAGAAACRRLLGQLQVRSLQQCALAASRSLGVTSTLGTSTPDLHSGGCQSLVCEQLAAAAAGSHRSTRSAYLRMKSSLSWSLVLSALHTQLDPDRLSKQHAELLAVRSLPVHYSLPSRKRQVLQVEHAVVLVPNLACGLALVVDGHHMPPVVLAQLQHSGTVQCAWACLGMNSQRGMHVCRL